MSSDRLTPFDFLNAINSTQKADLMDEERHESMYVPYIVNRSLSYFPDTVFYANQINQLHRLDNKLQFHFYLHSIRSRKRFAKWHKASGNEIGLIQEALQCSQRVARMYADVISETDMALIQESLNQGGKQ